jgi:hypothetical protein
MISSRVRLQHYPNGAPSFKDWPESKKFRKVMPKIGRRFKSSERYMPKIGRGAENITDDQPEK